MLAPHTRCIDARLDVDAIPPYTKSLVEFVGILRNPIAIEEGER